VKLKFLTLSVWLVAGLVLAAAPHFAQYHDAGVLSGSLEIHLTSSTGSVKTLYDNPSALQGLTMDTDNRLVVFGDGGNALGIHGLLKLDPVTRSVTTIISHPSLLYAPFDVVVDPGGDYVFTNRYARQVTPTFTQFSIGLFKYSPAAKTLSTIATTVSLGRPALWYGGLGVDIDTGDFIVQDRDLTAKAPLLRIKPNGAIQTVATGLDPRYSITQDIRTGDWYSAAGGQILRVKKGASTAQSLFPTSSGFGVHTAIAFDRASAAKPRVVSRYRDQIFYVDPTSASITSMALSQRAATPWDMAFFRGRNLASVSTGPRRQDLKISFPTEAGKGYVIGLSLAGVRPGITLGDQRVINLSPDGFTLLTLANLLPGIWNPGSLVLDRNGEATARLDLTGIPPLNAPAWALALVVDQGTIGTIGDPIVLRL
jgi:hypothetical protein